jgi:hypothetical protein
VPHSNVASFATLEPALSDAEGVGFHRGRKHWLFPQAEVKTGSRVPRSNIVFFATLEPALSDAEGVGFHRGRKHSLFRESSPPAPPRASGLALFSNVFVK